MGARDVRALEADGSLLGRVEAETQLKSEVLPAPLGPMTAVMEFSATSKVTPDSAFNPPNDRLTASTERMGALMRRSRCEG